MALPFLACHRSEDYDPILKKWHLEGGDLAQLEREALEWDHAQVATWICSEWGLPENIALAIKNHHNMNADSDHEVLGPIRLVSILREDDSNNGLDEMIAKAEGDYNISEEKMQSIIEPSFEKAKDLARMIV
ncbi:MAG: HDOD domain-containing protein [Desulfobacula sp.]|nr:HDOD domain-containing protein [Desulfobacula sp.]